MSESHNVRFVEDSGKWLWKRYDADGSVIYRSPLFDTEREARADYEERGGENTESSLEETEETATLPQTESSVEGVNTDLTPGSAELENEQAPEGTV